ncbi:fumarylacetoacetate hydrolase family protein [Methanosarcinaceae archaeon]|nr:fumarylacetoacetate hydrolase family protein [Methanosarcinaceae archaeon]
MFGYFRDGDRRFRGEICDGIVIPDPEYIDVDDEYDLSALQILPPSVPTKIVCAGLNYIDHAAELGMELPTEPLIFLKPPSALIGHGDAIVCPPESSRVDYEAELGIIIGKRIHGLTPEEIENDEDIIEGFTCFNDVTARDIQKREGQWTRAKGYDTFAPAGPFAVTPADLDDAHLDPENLRIRSFVNNEVRQDSSTSGFIFSIPELISAISKIMTLEKGDIIATGTPPGIGQIVPGDVVDIDIRGIGRLSSRVV